MDEITRDGIMMLLKTIAQTIALIPTEELREYVNWHTNYLSRVDSIGSMLNPTAYRNAMYDGTLDDARNQKEIVEAILKVREVIDKRESEADKFRGNKK